MKIQKKIIYLFIFFFGGGSGDGVRWGRRVGGVGGLGWM